jgi:hypothetical protein
VSGELGQHHDFIPVAVLQNTVISYCWKREINPETLSFEDLMQELAK